MERRSRGSKSAGDDAAPGAKKASGLRQSGQAGSARGSVPKEVRLSDDPSRHSVRSIDSRTRLSSRLSSKGPESPKAESPRTGSPRSSGAAFGRGSVDSLPEDAKKQSGITVTIRVRPALPHENAADDAVTCAPDGKTLQLEGEERTKTVTVDEVIDSRREDQGSQKEFYDRVGRNLVLSALRDYNITIFAYGHTGSGKTHTMLGYGGADTPGAGLLPRAIQEIFTEHVKDTSKMNARFAVEYYEVYNESIRDLLAPTHVQGQDRKRTVHAHPKHGVRIDGLSTSLVKDAEETLQLVSFGNQMRTVAATTMNAQSSRSHAIFTFKFESDGSEHQHHSSVMTFVDLAGREDQAASQNKEMQFREMTYINTSLFHLSHLITKLSEGTLQKGSLADFRNSKLTLLLSQALVGNSCTALLATIAPSKVYLEDSWHTLSFAQQVKKIKTKPMLNNKKAPAVVLELENELEKLRKELSAAKSGKGEFEEELLAAQAMIKHLNGGGKDLEASSAEARKTRQRVSVTLGLSSMGVTGYNVPRPPNGGDPLPFLTKLSNDSSLQGCCNYFLVKSSLRIGSLEHGCDVIVQGVGVRPLMCVVKCSQERVVTVELPPAYYNKDNDEDEEEDEDSEGTSSEEWAGSEGEIQDVPRILINGQALAPKDGPRELSEGDCIVVGYAHAYRLVVPTLFDINMDAQSMARKKLDNMEVTVAMQQVEEEGGQQFKEILPFLRLMNSGAPESTVQAMMKALNALCPMLEEANLITAEIFGNDTICFKLHMLTDLFNFENATPQMTVAVIADAQANKNVIRGEAAQGGGRRKSMARGSLVPMAQASISDSMGISEQMVVNEAMDQLLYVWTLEKFMRRLNEMRDLYQDASHSNDNFEGLRKELRINPYKNPWREPAFADVRLLSERASGPEGPLRFQTGQFGSGGGDTVSSPSKSSISPATPQRQQQQPAEKQSWDFAAEALHDPDICQPTAVGSFSEEKKELPPEKLVHVESGDALNGLEAFLDESLPATLSIGLDDNLDDSLLRQSSPGKSVGSSFRNAPEVQRLRVELEACRQSRENADQGSDDFVNLLDKLEGLVNHLTHSPSLAAAEAKAVVASAKKQSAPSPWQYARRPAPHQYQVPVARHVSPLVAPRVAGFALSQPLRVQQIQTGTLAAAARLPTTPRIVSRRDVSPCPVAQAGTLAAATRAPTTPVIVSRRDVSPVPAASRFFLSQTVSAVPSMVPSTEAPWASSHLAPLVGTETGERKYR